MEIGARVPLCLVLAVLPTHAVLACSCMVSIGFCEKLPDASDPNRAVFVGTVREFYPKSREQMNQIFDDFYRTHQDLISQIRTRTSRPVRGASLGNLEFRKQFIQHLWGDALTPTEREHLGTANERDLDRLMFDYRRRARFDVVENFTGADTAQFGLYTNLDGPSCGFDFGDGGTYLIEAYRNPGDEHWRVSSCSRTRTIAAADEELRVLRAWKYGLRVPGRIQGHSGVGIRVRLLGGRQVLETVSDSRGLFEFGNLESGNYEVEVEVGAPVPARRSVDLTHAWCAQVFVPPNR